MVERHHLEQSTLALRRLYLEFQSDLPATNILFHSFHHRALSTMVARNQATTSHHNNRRMAHCHLDSSPRWIILSLHSIEQHHIQHLAATSIRRHHNKTPATHLRMAITTATGIFLRCSRLRSKIRCDHLPTFGRKFITAQFRWDQLSCLTAAVLRDLLYTARPLRKLRRRHSRSFRLRFRMLRLCPRCRSQHHHIKAHLSCLLLHQHVLVSHHLPRMLSAQTQRTSRTTSSGCSSSRAASNNSHSITYRGPRQLVDGWSSCTALPANPTLLSVPRPQLLRRRRAQTMMLHAFYG